ncbi:MAG TPA: hypothetical protein VF960_01785 [Chloroflexota bacterium]
MPYSDTPGEAREETTRDNPIEEASEGPVALPPALLHPERAAKNRSGRRREPAELENPVKQLALPLEEKAEVEAAAEEPQEGAEQPHRGKKGFTRVTRDADVARSYSDNVALGYAVARGLAQVLSSMPPEELAALKARVAQGAKRARASREERTSLGGGLQDS